MQRPRVGIIGASGYSGMVATRLLAAHPFFDLAFCTSDKWKGESVEARVGGRISPTLQFLPSLQAIEHAEYVDAVCLATSAEVSLELAAEWLNKSKIVVDFSGAFRLAQASDYPPWYRFTHHQPGLLSLAHYGLPEVFGRPHGALVANPGCYPTASLLALAPLVRERLIALDSIIIDAKSGVTGAGREANERLSFAEVDANFHAYKVLSHQHTPEIAQALTRVANAPVSLTFTAHLLPVRRGLLATCYARPCPGVTAERVQQCLTAAYARSAFVEVVAPEAVSLSRVVGTNRCCVGAAVDDHVVVVIAAIDNLIKGAAGQAVQNLNLMYDLAEDAGLGSLATEHPAL
ncbi:MAG: N-acetyl-gamma-glutamyl-phosphate reductase [Polyangiales bacterium]